MLELIVSMLKIISSVVIGGFGISWILSLLEFMQKQEWKNLKTYMEMKKRFPISTSIVIMIAYVIMMVIGLGLLKLSFVMFFY